jgi:hypothetical protein
MMQKKSTTVKQFLLGGALFVTVFAIGCNNSEKKDSTEMPATTAPAVIDSTPAVTTPKVDSANKTIDTALTKPTKTPTKQGLEKALTKPTKTPTKKS